MKLEGSTPVVPIDIEPDETDDERMARFLKAAGAATEFLAADLEKILENKNTSGGLSSGPTATAPDPSADNAVESVQSQKNQATASNTEEEEANLFEKLRNISVEAAEFSRLSSMKIAEGRMEEGDDGSGSSRNAITADADADAVERAEALCGRIENLLSAAAAAAAENDNDDDSDSSNKLRRSSTSVAAGGVERQHSHGDDVDLGVGNSDKDPGFDRSTSKSRRESKNCSHIGDIVCPNGRRDLALRLATARDALVAVIGERTSVGSLKVALLGLQSSFRAGIEQRQGAGAMETQWNDLCGRVSGLDNSVSDIRGSLSGAGQHRHRSIDMDTDNDGGGVTEDDLEERLGFKADVTWVQRELQRLWDALDARAMANVAGAGGISRPRSAPSANSSNSHNKNDNPEMAGEEESDVTPNSRLISTSLPSSSVLPTGMGGGRLQHSEHGQRSSFNEGSSIIKDLLRKTSRLEQQVRG